MNRLVMRCPVPHERHPLKLQLHLTSLVPRSLNATRKCVVKRRRTPTMRTGSATRRGIDRTQAGAQRTPCRAPRSAADDGTNDPRIPPVQASSEDVLSVSDSQGF